MTWKDKLEIGLKDDAPFRRDNLPDFQKKPAARTKKAGDATRSREEPGARAEAAKQAGPSQAPRRRAKTRPAPGRVKSRTKR